MKGHQTRGENGIFRQFMGNFLSINIEVSLRSNVRKDACPLIKGTTNHKLADLVLKTKIVMSFKIDQIAYVNVYFKYPSG